MSAARADNAARDLLARLTDEAELESVPLDEVRADLALLGIDPERAIRFGRRLAEEAGSPAAGLLAKSLAAEDDERELAALENADIDAVRSDLAAAAPLAAARAKELAGAVAAGAPHRRGSRRMWYSIAGTISAIAASLLIVVSLELPETAPQQMAFAPEDASAERFRRIEEPAAALPVPEAVPQQPTAPADESATIATSMSQSSGALANPKKKIADPNANANSELLSAGSAADRTTEAEPARKAESLSANFNHDFNGVTLNLGGSEKRSSRSFALPAAQGGLSDLTVAAALILQPERAPEGLRQADLGKGDLMARLPEAARYQFFRSVIALLTIQRADGTRFDGMLIDSALAASTWTFDREEGTAPVVQKDAGEPVGPIPEYPTVSDLVGAEAERLSLVDFSPPAAAGQQ